MKRYWLFEFDQCYAAGGMSDFVGDFDTIEEAEEARTVKFDVAIPFSGRTPGRDKGHHIFDLVEKTVVRGWDPYFKKKINFGEEIRDL